MRRERPHARHPAWYARPVSCRLHCHVASKLQPRHAMDNFERLTDDELSTASGALSAAANFIMMHESGGSTTAGHLHKQGRGDDTRGNHSSAFGAFQMIESQRKAY